MKNNKPGSFLTLLIFALSVCMFYFKSSYFTIGSTVVIYNYLLGLVIFGVCVFAFLARPDIPLLGKLSKTALAMTLPVWASLAVSLLLWVVNRSPMANITGGLSDQLYQLIAMMVALAYVMMFREKAPVVQVFSLAAANLLVVVLNYILVYGFGTFWTDYLDLIKYFGVNASRRMVSLEINDTTFAMGLFVVYFLVREGKVKGRFWLILMSLFFFTVGLKRSAAIGVGLALLVVLFARCLGEANRRRLLQVMSWGAAIAGFAYIFIVKYGIFDILAEKLNINTMGRSSMLHFIDSYYAVSPTFRGYGLGYVVELLLSGAASEYGNFTRLHNDFIMMYIELGFWGYLLWLGSYWIGRIRYLCKNRSIQCALMAFACLLYCYVTHLTDNTYAYFDTNVALFTVILSCSIGQEKAPEIQEG